MSSTMEQIPVTEVVYLEIAPQKDLKDANSPSGQVWTKLLILCEKSPGVNDVYWCRGIEYPSKVRLHIVRDTLGSHSDFHGSDLGKEFNALLGQLIESETKPEIRHALLQDNVPQNGIAHEAPVTGTAIMVNTNEVMARYAWPLWTHVVRHAAGNKGMAGGRVFDHANGQEAYLVYVGWETRDHHLAAGKTSWCADRLSIMTLGTDGMEEAYHVVFEKGPRSKTYKHPVAET